MSATLTIRDETASGSAIHEFPLEFPTERITIRELIRERVYQEVQDYNRRHEEVTFRGLVQPTDAEQVLNGDRNANSFRLPRHREINWEKQFDKAVEAFQRNGFFVIVDDRQAETLDEEFQISSSTRVSFVKLMPLVGG